MRFTFVTSPGTLWAGDETTDNNAGYWVSRTPAEPLAVRELTDLRARHDDAGIQLRVVDDLWSLWLEVIESTVAFSGIRLRNLARRT